MKTIYMNKDLDGVLQLININACSSYKNFRKLNRKCRNNGIGLIIGFAYGVYTALRVDRLETKVEILNREIQDLKTK